MLVIKYIYKLNLEEYFIISQLFECVLVVKYITEQVIIVTNVFKEFLWSNNQELINSLYIKAPCVNVSISYIV